MKKLKKIRVCNKQVGRRKDDICGVKVKSRTLHTHGNNKGKRYVTYPIHGKTEFKIHIIEVK
jgi:hypothetical protein